MNIEENPMKTIYFTHKETESKADIQAQLDALHVEKVSRYEHRRYFPVQYKSPTIVIRKSETGNQYSRKSRTKWTIDYMHYDDIEGKMKFPFPCAKQNSAKTLKLALKRAKSAIEKNNVNEFEIQIMPVSTFDIKGDDWQAKLQEVYDNIVYLYEV